MKLADAKAAASHELPPDATEMWTITRPACVIIAYDGPTLEPIVGVEFASVIMALFTEESEERIDRSNVNRVSVSGTATPEPDESLRC